MPRPDLHLVTPEGWLSRGEAFVTGQGQQLAVLGGIPGESCKVRVDARGAHKVHGRYVAADGPRSAERVDPPCDRYALCGHCPWMHLNPAGQGRARRWLLEQALSSAGVRPTRIDPLVPAGRLLYEIDLRAGRSDEGHPRIGVTGVDHQLVPIPECPVTTPGLREIMKIAAWHMVDLRIEPFVGGRGVLLGVRAIEAPGSGEQLILIRATRRIPQIEPYAEQLASGHAHIVGILVRYEDPDVPDTPPGSTLLYGRPTFDWAAGEHRLRVGLHDGFPANPEGALALTRGAIQSLNPQKGDAVVVLGDALGLFSLAAARKTGWALGVVPDPLALEHIRENATRNRSNAEFCAGDADEVLTSVTTRLGGLRPMVIVDLDRHTLADSVRAGLLALDPRRVLLLSTNPRALAREVALLQPAGLELRVFTPYDTAPFTPHGVTSALLVSNDLTGPTRRAPQRRLLRP